jgi:hypothetical protein
MGAASRVAQRLTAASNLRELASATTVEKELQQSLTDAALEL